MYKKRIKKVMGVMVYSLLLSTLLTGCNRTAGQLGMMPGSSSNQAAKEINCPGYFSDKDALGNHYGAFVCDPCRQFFRRIVIGKLDPTTFIPCGNCQTKEELRGCQQYRYDKCLEAGIRCKERKNSKILNDSTNQETEEEVIRCKVCFVDKANLKQRHYKVRTCHSCKAFFRRILSGEHDPTTFHCEKGGNCQKADLRNCDQCRYRKYLDEREKNEIEEPAIQQPIAVENSNNVD